MISIIVPVYNVEQYLDDCIQSIVDQTYTEWELILVDDGSTDGSPDIARQWANRTPRIKYFRKPNGGVSSARNFGLDHATGEYIMFVDSDDICHRDLLNRLVGGISDNIQLSVCRVKRFQTRPGILEYPSVKTIPLNSLNEIYLTLAAYSILHTPDSRLYNSEILTSNNIRFKENIHLGEDVLFNLEYLRYITAGVLIDAYLYYYRDTPGSLSKKIRPDYADIQLMILTEKINLINEYNLTFDFTQYAPAIVRDIALSVLRCDTSENEQIEALTKLRGHKIMDYCGHKGRISDILLAKAIKRLPAKIFLKLLK